MANMDICADHKYKTSNIRVDPSTDKEVVDKQINRTGSKPVFNTKKQDGSPRHKRTSFAC
jgi:hypothetical protein